MEGSLVPGVKLYWDMPGNDEQFDNFEADASVASATSNNE